MVVDELAAAARVDSEDDCELGTVAVTALSLAATNAFTFTYVYLWVDGIDSRSINQ